MYLLAASKNHTAAAHCCVIEDSPTGVTAGVAAGMTVFGYSALTPAQRLLDAGAYSVFNDMSRLTGLLGIKVAVT